MFVTCLRSSSCCIIKPQVSNFSFYVFPVEKSEPRSAGGGEAQHPSQKDPGGEDEEADAKRGVLEEERRGGALEDGNAVRSQSHLISGYV